MRLTLIKSGVLDAATALANSRKLVRDSTGRYWACYEREDSDNITQVFVACYSSGIWVEEQVSSGSSDQNDASIAIDSMNNLHVIWRGAGRGTYPSRRQIVYRQRTSSGWQTEELVTNVNANQFWYPAIAVDSHDDIHVVWTGYGWGVNTSETNIQYITRSGGSWSGQVGLTDAADSQINPSLAIDTNDNTHVAWDGRTWGTYPTKRSIQYRRRISNVWEAQEAITDIDGEEMSTSLAIDPDGNVHLVWYGPPTAGEPDQIQYRKRTTSGWDAIELVTDVAAPTEQISPTITVTQAGAIYVIWEGESYGQNTDDNNLQYRVKSGDSWLSRVPITDRNYDQSYANSMWAMYPVVNGRRTNIPSSPILIFTGSIDAGTTIRAEFVELTKYAGNINIDQLVYQHAERMQK